MSTVWGEQTRTPLGTSKCSQKENSLDPSPTGNSSFISSTVWNTHPIPVPLLLSADKLMGLRLMCLLGEGGNDRDDRDVLASSFLCFFSILSSNQSQTSCPKDTDIIREANYEFLGIRLIPGQNLKTQT